MSSRKKTKAARRRSMRLLLTMLITVTALVAFFAVFQLKTVYVKGNLHDSPDDVTAVILERPVLGNTILAKLMNTNRKITKTGFIESINTEILGTDTIRVYVTERTYVGCVAAGAYLWYFDASGKVMAQAKERVKGEHVPLVEGADIDVGHIELDSYLTVRSTKMFSMLAMLRARIDVSESLMPDLVRFDEDGNMTLIYEDVTVLMGMGEKLEMRLKQLAGVMPELMNGDYRGTLHLETYDGSQTGLLFDPA
ncbi:MAG: hypothetical protein Q4G47_03850 [Lachnospiraceae bacterium]|nr:hypothetical protein [Lachnospiraceae bacterium]